MRNLALAAVLLLTNLVVLADEPKSAVDRFLDRCRSDAQLDQATRQTVIDSVEAARRDPATADEAITAGLKLLSPDFANALSELANERSAEAAALLSPLTESPDSFLAAEARLFLARAMIQQQRFEDAILPLTELTDHRSADTARAAEAWYLRGKSEAAALNREAALADLHRFLKVYPEAPARMRREAQATLVDLDEAAANLLVDIHDKMNFSGRRLGLEDSGKRTQEVQDDVVALLTEMIEELEKKCGNCKGCKCSGSKPGGSGMGGKSPGMSSGSSQASKITERDGPRTPWVDLGQRYDDPTAFSASKTRIPLQYKNLVEQYYRSFQDSDAR